MASLSALPIAAGGLLLASTAGDSQVLVWHCRPGVLGATGAAASDTGTAAAAAAAAFVGSEVYTGQDQSPVQMLRQGRWAPPQAAPAGPLLQLCAVLAELPGAPGW